MTWKSPDMSGFGIEVGIFDPDENTAGSFETDTPQFQMEASYSTSFDGGSVMVWAGGLHQEMERTAGGEVTSVGFNLGAKVSAGGLSLVGSWFDGEAIGTIRTLDSFSGKKFGIASTAQYTFYERRTKDSIWRLFATTEGVALGSDDKGYIRAKLKNHSKSLALWMSSMTFELVSYTYRF